MLLFDRCLVNLHKGNILLKIFIAVILLLQFNLDWYWWLTLLIISIIDFYIEYNNEKVELRNTQLLQDNILSVRKDVLSKIEKLKEVLNHNV